MLDHLTPDLQQRIYATYRELRDQHPLFWDAGQHAWLLSRYEDVRRALGDPTRLGSGDTRQNVVPQLEAG